MSEENKEVRKPGRPKGSVDTKPRASRKSGEREETHQSSYRITKREAEGLQAFLGVLGKDVGVSTLLGLIGRNAEQLTEEVAPVFVNLLSKDRDEQKSAVRIAGAADRLRKFLTPDELQQLATELKA
ncbi:hypothetical protein ATN89_17565 [Comamonas thiooxydans]|uniref:hypothetical protein n=1 Tax=Comamonas thiooxydans TaxID=363952 RepID=UPI0007C503A9|nr:hypothetical protein [Comamonas thiooxydans]OAD82890.1 hypothetical protein ATN89_17565 [Comamonas thiooxydans]